MASAAKSTTPVPGSAKTSDFDDAPAHDARLFLVDGSSLAYRSFFALPPEIATSDGRPTNALLGYANMLFKLLVDFDPTTVVVAWDLPGATVRKQAFAEYKAHRAAMPDLLAEQWPHFKPLTEAFGFANLSHAEYEADDVIGTLATQASAANIPTCIVTSDRDAMQLVGSQVVLLANAKGMSDVAAFTPDRVELRFGVRPAQIPDLIGLRGDTSDNIPGVPGIGAKTAAQLLREFGSLETVLASIDKISGPKRKANLREFADQARVSKELATIVCDLPLDFDLHAVHAAEPDRSRLGELFRDLEFRSLVRRLDALDGASPGKSGAATLGKDAAASTGDGSATSLVSATTIRRTAREVSTHALGEAVAKQPADAAIAVLLAVHDDAASVACDLGEEHITCARGSVSSVAAALGGRIVRTFDYKALPKSLTLGDGRARAGDDLLLTSYLLEPGKRTYLVGEAATQAGIAVEIDAEGLDADMQTLVRDTAGLTATLDAHAQMLDARGMLALYRDVELPLAEVLAEVESVGMSIDLYRMGEISDKVNSQLTELRDRAYKLAAREFNLASPSQLATVLFEDLKLPAQRKGKTGYSTDARVLRDLRDLHPIIPVIERYRELAKLKNTYLDSLPGLVDPRDGRIHTTFSQTIAVTGRLSSVNPNLQNIPVRTSVGREIRSAFVPREGYCFVACDYSQVELRLLAHVTREPKLVEVLERGDDIHTATAAEIAGIEPADVTRELRSAAKAVNFGIIYGISSFGLAGQLQISREEAQTYIDRYLGRYPHVGDFVERTIEMARNDGYVTTLFGRRRAIPELRSRNHAARQLGERLAVNSVLQGTAADIMKLAMIRAHGKLAERFTSDQARIVLQIHDELLIEARDDVAREAAEIVEREMIGVFAATPPLVVSTGVGETWLDAH